MVKALLTLKTGAKIQIEGSPSEVKELLDIYSGSVPYSGEKQVAKRQTTPKQVHVSKENLEEVPVAELVSVLKDCDEFESIEKQILDKSALIPRILLPLYIVHEHMENKFSLSTGEISKVTKEVGVPIATANVSHSVAGSASRYVISDGVRKKGRMIRYKLSRRGLQFMKLVITGTPESSIG